MSDKKYFSYIRVSTQRQGQQGTSLAEQQAAIDRFAQSSGCTIIRRFEERETAAKQGRPVFLEMLKQLRTGRAQGVVIHKIDRSARNLKDWADLGALIDSGVEVHFASESVDLNSRGGRLSADIQAVVASDYIRNLREETKKGLYGRLKQGYFPFRAVTGYLDSGKGKPKRIDPVQGPLVKQAFELYATGRWGLIDLNKHMYDLGLRSRSGGRLSLNGIAKMLHNPFYVGVIRIEKTGDSYAGLHQPVVSKSLFDEVQMVIAGKNIKKRACHFWTFRRLIQCCKCGNLLIAERQKMKIYYRCHTNGCTAMGVKEESVLDSIEAVFKGLELRDREYDMLRKLAAERFAEMEDEADRVRSDLAKELETVKDRHMRLVDSYMDGILDKETYVDRKEQLAFEEQRLKTNLKNFNDLDVLPTRLDEFLELANSAYLSFKSANEFDKRELVKIVTSNLTANGKSVSIKLKDPFQIIATRQPFTDGSPTLEVRRTFSPLLSKLFKNLMDFTWNT